MKTLIKNAIGILIMLIGVSCQNSNSQDRFVNKVENHDINNSKKSVLEIQFYDDKQEINQTELVLFSDALQQRKSKKGQVKEVLKVELNWNETETGGWYLDHFVYQSKSKGHFGIKSIKHIPEYQTLIFKISVFSEKVRMKKTPIKDEINSTHEYSFVNEQSHPNEFKFNLHIVYDNQKQLFQLGGERFLFLQNEPLEHMIKKSTDTVTKDIYKKISRNYGKNLAVRYYHGK